MILETGFSWNGVLLYALVGVPLTLAQYALASRFGWIVPDLALILVVHAAFFRGAHEAGWIALLLGALCDLASGGFFGYFIVLRVAVLIGVRIGANWVLSEAPLFQ
ncbi:MAG: hypothetical protein AB1405_18090, partial [Bdellovibrionota bacterium]